MPRPRVPFRVAAGSPVALRPSRSLPLPEEGSVFPVSSRPSSNTDSPAPRPIPGGPGTTWRPLSSHGNSGDFTLGSAYNPGEVTGRCQGNGRVPGVGRGWPVGSGEVRTKAPTGVGGGRLRFLAGGWRERPSLPSTRRSPSDPPSRPRNGFARRGGAGRGGLGPALPGAAPPPDAPPSPPRSPRAPGCCLRAAAARGAGCRPRCCKWT